MTTPSNIVPRFARLSVLAFGVVSLLIACSGSTREPEKLCKPGVAVFCRCRDRDQGSKVCSEDGRSFGACEPCESADNPEGPLEPGDPGSTDTPPDGATDDASAPGHSCGDGVVESGEDCDDSNTDDDDGCNSRCELSGASPPASNACPGLEVHVWGGSHHPSLSSTTASAGNHSLKTTCNAPPNTPSSGAAGPDRVFKIVAHATGNLTVATTDANYNVFLYVSETCPTDKVVAIECSNKVDGPGDETMTVSVTAGKTYYAFVDGSLPSNLDTSATQGAFRVTFSIQ